MADIETKVTLKVNHKDEMLKLKKELLNDFVPWMTEKLDILFTDYKVELEDQWRKIADAEFYNQYSPNRYKRTYDLYNVIHIDEDTLDITIDLKYMENEHRVSNEYIFNQMYNKGWHGGAISGEGHPDSGTPYWRKPYPYYRYWYKPAVKKGGSIQNMLNKMTPFIKKFDRKQQQVFNEITEDLKGRIIKYTNNI